MSFNVKNPYTAFENNDTPSTPPEGTRGFFPKEDGWYDIDDKGNIKKVGSNVAADWNQTDETKADFIKNKPHIKKGIGENSTITNDIENNIAGMKGFYYSSIEFGTEDENGDRYDKITLSDKQEYGINTETNLSEMAMSLMGEFISVVNGSKYPNCCQVFDCNGNTITVGKLPFNSVAEVSGLAMDDYSLWVQSNPKIGVVPLGYYAHSEGENTIALERASHAEGRDTLAYGQYSHVEGRNTKASYAAHAEGNDTHAEGFSSHSEGSLTHSKGDNAHSEGYSTKAEGHNSHSEGYDTVAVGESSHVEGRKNTITERAKYGHAEGEQNIVNGISAHAEGGGNQARGHYSHAEGLYNIALGESQHVAGKFNVSDVSKAHILGGGTSEDDRKNIHTIDWNGNAEYAGTVKSAGKLLATEDYVSESVATMVDSAPETLNTLNELAEALNNDENFATTVTNEIAKKVDKEEGKGLSTNDFTDELKARLENMAVTNLGYIAPNEYVETLKNYTRSGIWIYYIEKTFSIIGGTPIILYVDAPAFAPLTGVLSTQYLINIKTRNISKREYIARQTINLEGSTTYEQIWTDFEPYAYFSDENFTSALKTKLENITVDQTYSPTSENAQSGKAVSEAIADIQISGGAVQSDWNETDTESMSYIQNKPTIPTKISQLEDDTAYNSPINWASYATYASDASASQHAFYTDEADIARRDMDGNFITSTYATKEELGTIENSDETVTSFNFLLNHNNELRLSTVESIIFTFEDGEYPDNYTSGLVFYSGETPTALTYSGTGILNWVGTDCSVNDGLSIFQPSINKQYDIIFYYNGTQFIGLVNGYVPATANG